MKRHAAILNRTAEDPQIPDQIAAAPKGVSLVPFGREQVQQGAYAEALRLLDHLVGEELELHRHFEVAAFTFTPTD